MIIVNKTAVTVPVLSEDGKRIASQKTYKPGTVLSEEALESLGMAEVERLLKIKTLRQVDEDADPEEEVAKLTQPGLFDLDPASLEGMDKDKLNAMLVERGADAEPTTARAIAALTRDFVPGDSTDA